MTTKIVLALAGLLIGAVLVYVLLALPTPNKPGGDDALIARAQRAVTQMLIDAESARFSEVRTNDGVVCGFVNAKNRGGGYDGFRPFLYSPAEDSVIIYGGSAITDDEVSHLARRAGFESICGKASP